MANVAHKAGVNRIPSVDRKIRRSARIQQSIKLLEAKDTPEAKAKIKALRKELSDTHTGLKAVKDALDSMELA